MGESTWDRVEQNPLRLILNRSVGVLGMADRLEEQIPATVSDYELGHEASTRSQRIRLYGARVSGTRISPFRKRSRSDRPLAQQSDHQVSGRRRHEELLP